MILSYTNGDITVYAVRVSLCLVVFALPETMCCDIERGWGVGEGVYIIINAANCTRCCISVRSAVAESCL